MCIYMSKLYFHFKNVLRNQVAPVVASCAVRLCSSRNDQRFHQYGFSASWRHVLAGLLAGTGAVLAYGLHRHKVTNGQYLSIFTFFLKFNALFFAIIC